MIHAAHLREEIVRPALLSIGLWSDAAENLVLGTIAQESAGGKYLRQLGSGPALGIAQMEPATYSDIWHNFLRFKAQYRVPLEELALPFDRLSLSYPPAGELVWNPRFAAAMCRVHYRRVKAPLPGADDKAGMAIYWKRHYNTLLGRGTTAEFIENYNTFVLGRTEEEA